MNHRDVPRLLVLMPELGARRGGGICQVGRSVMRLLAAKRREGTIDCRVLALGQPDADGDREELVQDWGTRIKWFGKNRVGFSIAAVKSMATWADAVISMHLGLSSTILPLPRFLRPTAITFIHGIEVWRPLRRRHRLALQASDNIVANSRFTATRARNFNPWLTDVECCHLGRSAENSRSSFQTPKSKGDSPRFAPRTTQYGDSPRGFETASSVPSDDAALSEIRPTRSDILTIGRMAKGEGGKGHRELIAAMEAIVAKVPDARLLIGGTGNDVETYVDLARGSPVADRIVFLGYVPDEALEALYRRVGVFAMPSRQEGFGLVYLEAMAARLPCLASTLDAAGEIVAHETGLLVDPSDQTAIVAALVRLLSDHEFRERLGRQGRKRLEEHFTESHFHQRFWTLIERALSEKPKRRRRAQRHANHDRDKANAAPERFSVATIGDEQPCAE